ncbi:MAG: YkgJ family cysteine cluster protein [bacterium]
MVNIDRTYFFDDGLKFGCTQCGHCCACAPGKVFLTEEEACSIAGFLKLDPEAFRKEYLVTAPFSESSLREKPDHDCIFLVDRKCSIYDVRPEQCRTYPFWFGILRTPEGWAKEGLECPGIGNGNLFTKEEIIARCDMNRTH